MTLSEFKAWFDGFCENVDGRPTEEQWRKIRDKFGNVDKMSVSFGSDLLLTVARKEG